MQLEIETSIKFSVNNKFNLCHLCKAQLKDNEIFFVYKEKSPTRPRINRKTLLEEKYCMEHFIELTKDKYVDDYFVSEDVDSIIHSNIDKNKLFILAIPGSNIKLLNDEIKIASTEFIRNHLMNKYQYCLLMFQESKGTDKSSQDIEITIVCINQIKGYIHSCFPNFKEYYPELFEDNKIRIKVTVTDPSLILNDKSPFRKHFLNYYNPKQHNIPKVFYEYNDTENHKELDYETEFSVREMSIVNYISEHNKTLIKP